MVLHVFYKFFQSCFHTRPASFIQTALVFDCSVSIEANGHHGLSVVHFHAFGENIQCRTSAVQVYFERFHCIFCAIFNLEYM